MLECLAISFLTLVKNSKVQNWCFWSFKTLSLRAVTVIAQYLIKFDGYSWTTDIIHSKIIESLPDKVSSEEYAWCKLMKGAKM